MKEEFLHYIWKYKLFDTSNLLTTVNESISIIDSGVHNLDAGPDFFNGKIKINATIWAGNVEIHIKSSDWYKHHHQNDKAYDNVILHVVYEDDKPVINSNKEKIPTIELKDRFNSDLWSNYSNLINSKNWIPCGQQVIDVDDFTVNSWLNRLSVERLERKSVEIKNTLQQNNNDWETTFYRYLLKYFGMKVNAIPFEQLAINTPLKIVEKHNSVLSVEALFYGQAGFLEEDVDDEYFVKLKKEYQFLKAKFSLTELDRSNWKFLRLRPSNFPTIRLSQIASLLKNSPRLFSKIMQAPTISDLQKILSGQTSFYWEEHYQFGKKIKTKSSKNIGKSTIDNIIINVVVPFLFLYGKEQNNQQIVDQSLAILENLKSEKNSIIKKWEKLGVKSGNALRSQSLLELKDSYCSEKKCLNCNIGNKILQS